jgi:hypothetical protein
VTRVYVDVAAALLEGAAAPSLDPAAVRALGLLAETGNEVVLVTGQAGPPPAALTAVARDAVGVAPDHPATPSWYLTSDVEHCRGTSARLRTVLIGATPASGSVHRCDGVARDVQAAVMEILASEAMPQAVSRAGEGVP